MSSTETLSDSSRYPNISCELLTSDVGQINDRLGEDESLLMKLYGFLQNEPPLNPLLASFFSKVLSILIGRKPEQVALVAPGLGSRGSRCDFVCACACSPRHNNRLVLGKQYLSNISHEMVCALQ